MTERETDLELFAKRRIGTVLRGKYRLDRLLGVGGMAVVYKATHRNQAEFAVKMLHPELSLREDVRTRFLREGYAANSVKHPGAVLVVDDDVAEDGAAFLVMELLDGEGVEQLWERMAFRVPPRDAAAIISQLLDVLTAAHAKGIVHRDIKPANLFVLRDGVVKVLDFGIARARDAAASGAQGAATTGTGMLLGTPAFMPPEQALARSSDIDGQTDVWAAGATFFTLVSSHYVHEGENAPQLMIRAATVPARPIGSVAPHVPPPIAHVIDRALAFDKAARWPTAAAMREALEAAGTASFGQPPSSSKAVLAHVLSTRDPALAATATPEPFRPQPPAVAPAQAPAPAESSPRQAPVFVGGTTAQPISSTQPERPRPRRNGLVFAGGAGAAALVGVGAVVLMMRSSPSSSMPPVGLAVPAVSASASTAAPTAPSATATTPPPPTASATLAPAAEPTIAAAPTPPPMHGSAPTAKPKSTHSTPPPPAPATPPPAAQPAAPKPPPLSPRPTSDNPLDMNIK